MINDPNPTSPNQSALEPGLLSVFRLIVTVMLGLQVLSVLSIGYAVWSGETPPQGVPVDSFIWLSAIEPVALLLLLFCLFSTALQQRLGRFYLSVMVALFTIGAIVQRYLFLLLVIVPTGAKVLGDVELQNRLEGNTWILVLALLVPLVMMAWQYNFKHVICFVLGTVFFEAALIWLFVPADMPPWLFIEPGFKEATAAAEPVVQLPGTVDSLLFIALPRTVILLMVGYIVTRMIGAQRHQRLALAAANDKLREQSAALEQLTISRERNRMARELHDTLAHSLSAVSVQLEAVDSALESSPQEARNFLTKALAQTRSGLAETRRAMQSLRASPLDDLGLRLALQTLAESMARRGGLKLDLQLDEIGELPPATEQNIYRIAQEALTNVVKHAQARQMRVTLAKPNGKVLLTVQDDGVGFAANVDTRNGHFGLAGMNERAELIGASVAVQSQPGGGTVVKLVV